MMLAIVGLAALLFPFVVRAAVGCGGGELLCVCPRWWRIGETSSEAHDRARCPACRIPGAEGGSGDRTHEALWLRIRAQRLLGGLRDARRCGSDARDTEGARPCAESSLQHAGRPRPASVGGRYIRAAVVQSERDSVNRSRCDRCWRVDGVRAGRSVLVSHTPARNHEGVPAHANGDVLRDPRGWLARKVPADVVPTLRRVQTAIAAIGGDATAVERARQSLETQFPARAA